MQKSSFSKGFLLNSLELQGPEQMAIDEMMLEKCITGGNLYPYIRFYTWKGTWLSIGRNQKDLPVRWLKLVKERKLNIVRRPSGGSAVLHSGGLTYSLVWPSAPKKRRLAYLMTCQWLKRGFEELDLSLKFGDQPIIPQVNNCFAKSTEADLEGHDGQKRIGNAQFWRNGTLLQHGEILLDPPKDIWLEIFNSHPPDPIPSDVSRESLIKSLTTVLSTSWPEIKWERKEINDNELHEASLKSHKYLLKPDQSGLSTTPVEIIASTT